MWPFLDTCYICVIGRKPKLMFISIPFLCKTVWKECNLCKIAWGNPCHESYIGQLSMNIACSSNKMQVTGQSHISIQIAFFFFGWKIPWLIPLLFHKVTSLPFILLVPCYSFSITHQALDIGHAKIPIDIFQRNITELYTHT